MSGVRTGTRLEQLRKLHARIGQEIAQEEVRVATEGGLVARRRPVVAPRTLPPHSIDQWLQQLGVTSREVKQWAADHGLVDGVKRGRLGRRLVEAYAIAHEIEQAVA